MSGDLQGLTPEELELISTQMVTLTPLEVAVLFSLFGRPVPPELDGVLESVPFIRRRRTLAAVDRGLLDRGILVQDDDGAMSMAQGPAMVISVCIAAEHCVSLQFGSRMLGTAYFVEDQCAVLRRDDDIVQILRLPAEPAGIWVDEMLSTLELQEKEDCEPFDLETNATDLERVLVALGKGDVGAARDACVELGWNADVVVAAAQSILSTEDRVSAVAVTVGEPGVNGSTVVPYASCAVAMGFEIEDEGRSAWIGCYDYDGLARAMRRGH